MDSGDPIGTGEQPASGPPRAPSSTRLIVILIAVVAIAAAGVLLLRRSGASHEAPGAVPATGTSPPGGLNVVVAPVRLTPKAMLVADRFQCLCGECQDTLGKCTCTRDKGSNDMKAALNRIVEEKSSLPEIEAAMVAQFGQRVLASGSAPASNPSK